MTGWGLVLFIFVWPSDAVAIEGMLIVLEVDRGRAAGPSRSTAGRGSANEPPTSLARSGDRLGRTSYRWTKKTTTLRQVHRRRSRPDARRGALVAADCSPRSSSASTTVKTTDATARPGTPASGP